ncbi:MAG: hypothetical protein JSS27_02960 [Planctomycetes bacterium]|nr:hypothetical protein [Planctomycetota bacterium]
MSANRPGTLSRWSTRVTLLLATLLALVVLAPWILSNPPVLNWVLELAQGRMRGNVALDDLELSWWRPTGLAGLRLTDEEHRPFAAIGRIDTERSLGNLALDRHDLGTIRVVSPELHVVATPERNNIRDMFPHLVKPADPDQGKDAAWNPTSAKLIVDKLKITWCGAQDEQRWAVLDMSTAVNLIGGNRAEDRPATIVVEPTRVFDHFDVSPELCHDVLKYIAPPVAGVLRTDGRVTLELDGARFPIGRPEQATLSGRMKIHSLDIGPGPVVQAVTSFVGVPERMALTREDLIEFRLEKGRMYHEGLELGSENIRIRTRGSVGMDQSLDIVAEVHLRLSEATLAARPALRGLASQPLVIPVRGTLQKPQIDAEVIGRSALGAAMSALSELRGSDRPNNLGKRIEGIFGAIQQASGTQPSPLPAPGPAIEAPPVPNPPAPNGPTIPNLPAPANSSVPATPPAPLPGPGASTSAPPAPAKPAATPAAPKPELPKPAEGTAATPPAAGQPGNATDPAKPDLPGMAADMFQDLMRLRRERRAREAAANPPPATNGAASPNAATPVQPAPPGGNGLLPPPPPNARPARRLLRGALDRALNELTKPAEPTPGTTPAPGTPAPSGATPPPAAPNPPAPSPSDKPAPREP